MSLIDYNGLGSEPPIWLDLLSTALDFVPVLGDIKNVVEAGVGYDLAGNKLSALDRAMMLIPGGDVARAAAKIAKISAKMAVKHGDQVVSITKKAAKRVARDKTKKAIDKSEEVVIYLRTDLKTGKKYVGQTIKKKFDNEARKIEHQRKNKAEYKMDQLETVDSKMADLAEENWIRKKGGPEIYGGTLENKRYQLNDKDYIKAGGKIERPTGNKRLPQFKKLKKLGNKIKNRLPKKRKYPKRKIRAKF
ncbi:MAG: pre-toxin TG domain-containing protein [Bacteroidota bacterium]